MYFLLPKTSIFYKVKGSGVPVVILHGFPLDHTVMEGALEPVFKKIKGFKRVYLDLPTMGRSGATSSIKSSKAILDTLAEFISLLTKNEKIILVGHSYGAYLARALAIQYPEKISGMALIAPVVIADPSKRELPRHKTAVGKGFKAQLHGELEKRLFEKLVVRNRVVWGKVKRYIVPAFGRGNKFLQGELWEKGYSLPASMQRFKKRFEGPVLVVTGRNDSTVGYKDIKKVFPQFKHHTYHDLRDCGHDLMFEQHKQFTDIILDWLKDLKCPPSIF